MEDDDEFGDLYTDVLPPHLSASAPPPLFASSSSPALVKSSLQDDGERLHSRSGQPPRTLPPPLDTPVATKDREFNWEEDDVAVDLHDSEVDGGPPRVSGVPEAAESGVGVYGEPEGKMDIDIGISGVDSEEPVIPGLSVSSFAPPIGGAGSRARASESVEDDDGVAADDDNWGSDSEDDLQIVLNDNTNPIVMDGRDVPGMDDDDDDEDGEDLVIVADEGVHLSQPIEEQEGGDEVATAAGEGERKDGSDAGKVNGGVAGAVGGRIGYSNHVYHPHHSQFKYVRPGASVASGVAAATGSAVSQVRPPATVGLIAGRGRGEWRPMGIKGSLQKNFYPGHGPPVWGSSVRSFGSGSEFTLPSHKTVFDVDIDSFEEKPWRTPGVDISDYFNFGLDEDNWKNYCKQLEQFRLEATMQSKIRVYESGRSEQEYDPDLPPELAAAAGLHDGSAENANVGSVDGGQGDTTNQGKTATRIRSQLPTGRPIQVETGCGERLPSIDTRPPRTRDSDAIIEIVLLDDAKDDSITSNGTLEQPANESHVEDFNGDDGDGDADRFTSSCGGKNKESVVKTASSLVGPSHDKDVEIISEAAEELHPSSDVQDTSGDQTLSYRERRSRGKELDALPIEIEAMRELSVEQNDGGFDDRLALGDSVEGEGEEMTSGVGVSGNDEDCCLVQSVKKKKLSSQVEPAAYGMENGHELRPSLSDNSKPGSGSSRHYQKSREGGDEEVAQDGQSRRIRVTKRMPDDDKHSDRRRDDYYRDNRKDVERNRIVARGREDIYNPHSHRDFDASSGQYARAKIESFERQKQRDASVRSWQRRDEDMQGRRAKHEEIRSRDQIEETGSRHRMKIRENERNEKDEHLYLRKRVVEGDWRSHHEKDVGPRLRERDDNLMGRHEALDDSRLKRRKDEELLKREHEKEESLPGYRGREDRRKRERDDVVDLRRRDDPVRLRDKPDESYNSVKKRDENWRQRGREDKQRGKKSYEEDKLVESGRSREEPKGIGSDKEYAHRDKRRQTESHKRRDGGEEETSLQYRGHEDINTREGQVNNDGRYPRNDRSNRQRDDQVYKERRKQNGRKEKEAEGSDQNTVRPDIRKQDDHGDHGHEKVSSKITTELDVGAVDCNEDGNPRSTSAGPYKKHHHHNKEKSRQPSSGQGEDATSDEELQLNSRRGRSKMERWSSHKEKDGNHIAQGSQPQKESNNGSDGGIEQPDELHKVSEDTNDKSVGGLESKDTDNYPVSDNRSVDLDRIGNDRHSDTVAKLKKRSERFKLPMPGEKDTSTNRKVEADAVVAHNETANDAEIKQERPARKRRNYCGASTLQQGESFWTNS